MVNEVNFINTSAVTLATGKVNVNDNKVVFDTNNKSSLDINESATVCRCRLHKFHS